MKERRKHKRTEIDILVNYSKKAKVLTKNISEAGMCILSDSPFIQGTILNLRFYLLGKEEIKVYGKVIWNREIDPGIYENGIEFWNINNKDKETIKKYINDKVSSE